MKIAQLSFVVVEQNSLARNKATYISLVVEKVVDNVQRFNGRDISKYIELGNGEIAIIMSRHKGVVMESIEDQV